jgi:tRNA nucleotidyltransferase (CCA-adding enzyme)
LLGKSHVALFVPAVKTNAEAPNRGWEQFPHDADVGLRGWGPSIEVAFEQAALALTGIVTDAEIAVETRIAVACEAPDVELLLVEWLNAIIYEMAVRSMLFGRFEVKITGTRLQGALWGEPIDQVKHLPACEPKGATYTALRVAQGSDGLWSAGCVVDV